MNTRRGQIVEVGMFECSLDPKLIEAFTPCATKIIMLPSYALLSFEATYSEWDNSVLEARLLGRTT